jgi:hypothetical protein
VVPNTTFVPSQRQNGQHRPWQNPAELNGVKYLKLHAQVLLNRTGKIMNRGIAGVLSCISSKPWRCCIQDIKPETHANHEVSSIERVCLYMLTELFFSNFHFSIITIYSYYYIFHPLGPHSLLWKRIYLNILHTPMLFTILSLMAVLACDHSL